ncbi:50S ribosomal protein L11 methyltransferase [Alteriqipengyuania sp. WL0013]|uniref:50S ribosomal protein L11 methyltransferase n=1 Tax=Alteriqipengyuania sp. WL0013 TaxID=3110773 RepID=UPI002C40F2FC|nr:50S ribosomal protein L11 methyltransferase [Alteriqipengyuania sp. WL0013]MEB3414771.1 50S ribosomal protein L11 methyltransferase [Alteriqipengyuania sp. WL0013]
MTSWRIFGQADKPVVQAALLAHDEIEDWPADFVIAGREIAPDRPDDWVIEAWLPHRPRKGDVAMLADLFDGDAPAFDSEKLPDEDWVTLSQQGVDPIRAGPFRVRTPEHEPLGEDGTIEFVIPASQAFGTGQHETTAGCLSMLAEMRRTGVVVRNHADIGTGTGLLAFAAMRLWPAATATASDIDPVCEAVVADNMAANGVAAGTRRGQLTMTTAAGMEGPVLAARGPYDLLIANILAGPLVELSADFADHVSPRGRLLLAGLLGEQEPRVREAYRLAGFHLVKRLVNGDWSILWLRKGTRR